MGRRGSVWAAFGLTTLNCSHAKLSNQGDYPAGDSIQIQSLIWKPRHAEIGVVPKCATRNGSRFSCCWLASASFASLRFQIDVHLAKNPHAAGLTWPRRLARCNALRPPIHYETTPASRPPRIRRPSAASALAADGAKKNILLLAGRPSHGPGEHEHNAGCCFSKSAWTKAACPSRRPSHLSAEWPSAEELAKADTIVFYSDGGGGHFLLEGRSRSHRSTKEMKRGAGFVACTTRWSIRRTKAGRRRSTGWAAFSRRTGA